MGGDFPQGLLTARKAAALGAIAFLKGEIWKAAFTATGIVVAAIAVATGVLLSQLA